MTSNFILSIKFCLTKSYARLLTDLRRYIVTSILACCTFPCDFPSNVSLFQYSKSKEWLCDSTVLPARKGALSLTSSSLMAHAQSTPKPINFISKLIRYSAVLYFHNRHYPSSIFNSFCPESQYFLLYRSFSVHIWLLLIHILHHSQNNLIKTINQCSLWFSSQTPSPRAEQPGDILSPWERLLFSTQSWVLKGKSSRAKGSALPILGAFPEE